MLIFSILFLGCSTRDYIMFSKHYDKNLSKKSIPRISNYRYKIKVHDRISVVFYGHPELGTPKGEGILVNSKGEATFPLIGSVKVSNFYEDNLASYLEKKYSKYIVNPQININILNQKVIVLGAVQKPGIAKITNETMNLFEAIALRGGISKIGKRNGIVIVRGDLKNPQIHLVDLTDVQSIKNNNLTLYPNDIVYVTPNINLLIEQGLTSSTILNLILGAGVSLKTLNQ